MKALVFTEVDRVEVLDVDEPVAGQDEVVVEVEASGICGSELHGIRQIGFRVPPLVLGHEFVGWVDGERVAVNPLLACGRCDRCLDAEPHLCRVGVLLGGQAPGGSADRVAVPRHALRPIPAFLAVEAAGIIEPLANGIHALRVGGARPGHRLGIIGAGAIGLVNLLVARALGIDDVTVTDLSPQRREWAGRLGATMADDLSGEFDLIVDAVGAPATRRASLERLRPGGTAVWVGLLSGDVDFDAKALVRKEQRVVGSFAYTPGEFSEAADLAADVDASFVTTWPLSDGASVFRELAAGRSDLVKVLLTPDALG